MRFGHDPSLLEETGVTEVILEVLCCFSRIDFDFVSPYLSSVLPVVAKVTHRTHAYQSLTPDRRLFLSSPLHRKQRTNFLSLDLITTRKPGHCLLTSPSYSMPWVKRRMTSTRLIHIMHTQPSLEARYLGNPTPRNSERHYEVS